jgi:outer membrane protein assembly factor BamB
MGRVLICILAAGALSSCAPPDEADLVEQSTQTLVETGGAYEHESWPQWAHDAQHRGMVSIAGQHLRHQLADIIYDPFVPQERAEQFGILSAHYQVPLVDGDDVFMEFKTGTYISCDPPGWMTTEPCGVNTWNTQIWNERRLRWQGGHLVQKWNFASDWKPPPVPALNLLGPSEPVFHAILANGFVYVPGAGGTLFKLAQGSGAVVARINPFGTLDSHTFEAGPPVADRYGNLYYSAIRLASSDPWNTNILGAWLIKVRPDNSTSKVSFTSLALGAPAPGALCKLEFSEAQLPWPPSPNAVPPSVPCGSQRPAINGAPGVAPDGTVYVVSRAHRADRYSYLLAVNPDLTPRWASSFRDRLNDGCGTATLPPNGTLGGCRAGAHLGVDPATNEKPAGRAVDPGTNAPVVTPDGSILFGTYTEYNYLHGKLFKFSAAGQFRGTYDFGLDITPTLYSHDGTYSIILKDNHYEYGTYCTNPEFCATDVDGPYDITQLAPDLTPEWKFTNTSTESCVRNPDGTLSCEPDPEHPHGFEWCINAVAVDKNGVVYVNSEDGNLYSIAQGGVLKQRIFLQQALGAAYTPLSIGPDGKIYTQNAGHLFVVGD